MKSSTRVMLRLGIAAATMLVPTWLLWGPFDAFHHMVRFGFFRYMFWNGEDPDPDGVLVWGHEVHADVWAVALTAICWSMALFVAICFARNLWKKPNEA